MQFSFSVYYIIFPRQRQFPENGYFISFSEKKYLFQKIVLSYPGRRNKMQRNGHTLYHFATHEENGIRPSSSQQGAWDYGRLNHLPLWPEFVIFSTWRDYCKRFPNSFIYTLEIPLQSRLQITRHEEPCIVAPGNAYVIPVGDGCAMRTLPGEKCWKFCCGICGECAETFFSRLSPFGGVLPISDIETVCSWGNRVMRLLWEKRKESVPQIAGLAAELLTWLLEQKTVSNVLPFEIANALRIFECRFPQKISMDEVSREFGISTRTFTDRFEACMGISPKQYIIGLRMKSAENALLHTNLSIKDIAQKVGYATQFSFCREFLKHHGISPSAWRKRKRSEESFPTGMASGEKSSRIPGSGGNPAAEEKKSQRLMK